MLSFGVTVHSHHHLFAGLDRPLVLEGGLLDFPLHVAGLDGLEDSSHGVDLAQVFLGAALDLARQAFDGVRAGERVHGVGDAALERQDLLGAERDERGSFGRQGERLVPSVRVQ